MTDVMSKIGMEKSLSIKCANLGPWQSLQVCKEGPSPKTALAALCSGPVVDDDDDNDHGTVANPKA